MVVAAWMPYFYYAFKSFWNWTFPDKKKKKEKEKNDT